MVEVLVKEVEGGLAGGFGGFGGFGWGALLADGSEVWCGVVKWLISKVLPMEKNLISCEWSLGRVSYF